MGFGRFGAIAAALLLAGFSPAQAERSAASAALGAENHPQILARFGGEVPDSTLRDYVARVAGNIVAVSAQPDEDWLFTVLDSAQVNAFALPGGYVYVTRGLLALAGDEAELAAVLAHEIVHVTQEHVEARVDAQAEDQTGEVVGNLLGNLLGGVISGSENPLGDALRNTIQDSIGGRMEFSRAQEFEADVQSIPLLIAAGYDPMAASDFLAAMRDQHALIAELAGRGYNPSQVPFFADHPAPDDRIARAAEIAADMRFIAAPERGLDTHLAAIDGMIFGDSPAQGYVRGRAFLHTELGFSFAVPEGFRITNTARAVRASGPNGTSIVMDGGRDDGSDLRQYIARQWLPALRSPGQRPIRASRVRALSINGLEAAQTSVTRRVRGQAEELTLTAIRLNGSIYRFTGTSPRGQDAAQDAMRRAVETFAAMSPDAAAVLQPYRLTRHQIAQGDTVESLTGSAPADVAAAEWFAVLNGLPRGSLPAMGEWVKVIQY